MTQPSQPDGASVSQSSSPDPNGFSDWFLEVHRIATLLGWTEKARASIDREAWKFYFGDGHTPAEAWLEEYDCANR